MATFQEWVAVVQRVFDNLVYVLKRHLGFGWKELYELPIDRAKRLYQQWKDEEVLDKCFRMGLAGVDYRSESKIKTRYYIDYLDEMDNRDEKPDIREELIARHGIRIKLELPERLKRHNKDGR